jgi:hypothetical protein
MFLLAFKTVWIYKVERKTCVFKRSRRRRLCNLSPDILLLKRDFGGYFVVVLTDDLGASLIKFYKSIDKDYNYVRALE